MGHVALLGDSILDNGAYTGEGPDVITQLRPLLPAGWAATLVALDGSVALGLIAQATRIPRDATHLVVSAGGNDALGHAGLLGAPARSAGQVLDQLAEAVAAFESDYRAGLGAVLQLGLPTIACTIYNGNSPDAVFQRRARTALTLFNDVILRVAFGHALTIVDLRYVCSEAADYANPIEPSSHGGAKIARAIAGAVAGRATGARVVLS
ncbi:MAG: SGNH/GDSL hydrolase family protein [Gemmatimonadota bacterium]